MVERGNLWFHLNLPAPPMVEPERVATDIFSAAEENPATCYAGRRFWLVMTSICSIPEALFEKLRL
jgi:hypothetical protein